MPKQNNSTLDNGGITTISLSEEGGSKSWTVSYRLAKPGLRTEAKLETSAKYELLIALQGHYPVFTDVDQGFALTFTLIGPIEHVIGSGTELLWDALDRAGLDEYHIVEARLVDHQDFSADAQDDMPLIYYGVTECAQALEVTKQRISQLVHSGDFPSPDARVGSRPAWLEDTIRLYAMNRKK